jgi:hypothetical protein
VSEKTRISVFYGGIEYAVSGRSIDDVMAEIAAGTTADAPTWMTVSTGQGRSTSARILLGRGMPVAVWAVNADGAPTPVESDPVDPVPIDPASADPNAQE